jgi:ABC-type antimicrobial peptide transport system permease subunit
VEQRRREIGVRMALGASAQVVRQTFVKEGLRLAGIGAAIGLLGAAIGNQILASMLFGVGGIDVLTLGGVVLLFIVIASLASLFPAMSASRVHPMRALRHE